MKSLPLHFIVILASLLATAIGLTFVENRKNSPLQMPIAMVQYEESSVNVTESHTTAPTDEIPNLHAINASQLTEEHGDAFSEIPLTNESWELPIDMQFNDGHVLSIVGYSVIMVLSAVGNITVLSTIIKFRLQARLNRVNLFLFHLAIADLLVTFLLMPLEIGWNATVSWRAGDSICRIMMFFRTFGLYLSGFLLVCISLDRYFAVLKPLALPEANRRGRLMIAAAWIGSFLCSLPQAVVFHVERHPIATWFEQCVTFYFFTSEWTELAYNIFVFVFMYGFPLTMILFCYLCILYEIFKINNMKGNQEHDLRRSNMGALGRAKIRTLKMTVVIVAAFFLCWTPYNIMTLWYWIDKPSALKVDQRVQKALFLFACFNSCVNPCVYGLFHIHTRSKPGTPRSVVPNKNNCRLQRLDKPPYKMRVRWKPRECLCATGTSSGSPLNSSSGGRLRSRQNRPLCEFDGPGRPVYLSGQQNLMLNMSMLQTNRPLACVHSHLQPTTHHNAQYSTHQFGGKTSFQHRRIQDHERNRNSTNPNTNGHCGISPSGTVVTATTSIIAESGRYSTTMGNACDSCNSSSNSCRRTSNSHHSHSAGGMSPTSSRTFAAGMESPRFQCRESTSWSGPNTSL